MGANGQDGKKGNFCMMTGKKQRLEDLVSFPTDYRFKIMGRKGDLDIEAIIVTMESICEETVDRERVEARESSGGTYTSYTVPVHLTDASRLTAVYDMLSKQPHIKYYL